MSPCIAKVDHYKDLGVNLNLANLFSECQKTPIYTCLWFVLRWPRFLKNIQTLQRVQRLATTYYRSKLISSDLLPLPHISMNFWISYFYCKIIQTTHFVF